MKVQFRIAKRQEVTFIGKRNELKGIDSYDISILKFRNFQKIEMIGVITTLSTLCPVENLLMLHFLQSSV